jgi:T-complex protein 1 subunit theta
MGDNTNFVVVFAGELLQQADYLLRMGLHPSEVIEGYDVAVKKAFEILQSKDLMIGSIKRRESPF